MIRRHLE